MFPFPNPDKTQGLAGHFDSHSDFFIAANQHSAHYSRFFLPIVPTLRTSKIEHEKSCQTRITWLDTVSIHLFQTRLNSSLLCKSRFANGINVHAIPFTAFNIWQFALCPIKCTSEFITMATKPERYPALYLIFTLLNAIRRNAPPVFLFGSLYADRQDC